MSELQAARAKSPDYRKMRTTVDCKRKYICQISRRAILSKCKYKDGADLEENIGTSSRCQCLPDQVIVENSEKI